MSKRYFISFYCEGEDGELSGALREVISVLVAKDHKDNRSLNKIIRRANKKGRELGASHFGIYEQTMPRVWPVTREEQDNE